MLLRDHQFDIPITASIEIVNSGTTASGNAATSSIIIFLCCIANDYSEIPDTLTIKPLSTRACFYVWSTDDTELETNEVIELRLSSEIAAVIDNFQTFLTIVESKFIYTD